MIDTGFKGIFEGLVGVEQASMQLNGGSPTQVDGPDPALNNLIASNMRNSAPDM